MATRSTASVRPHLGVLLWGRGGARHGLTLAELVIVLAILAMLSAMVVPMAGNCVADSRNGVTRQNLTRLRDMIAETYWQDNDRRLPQRDTTVPPVPSGRTNTPQLRYLFVNPHTEDATVQYDPVYRRGWRGPYLVDRGRATYTISTDVGFLESYGENGDPTVLDGWGRPIVLQNPGALPDGRQDVRLVSAGPDGVVNIAPDKLTADLSTQDIGDDVWVSFGVR
jgi:prepilin-type N-terminal cleavage/methylation domain-containing protein